MNDKAQRRDAIARAGFDAADVRDHDIDAIDELAVGRDVDTALDAGSSTRDIAEQTGYTETVLLDLQHRYRTFRDECAAREQIPLF
ncbi:urea amidohydrolase [Rhodococcus sp. BP-252]|uniref:urea amidohydrolase n=1 Tax=unclassified Rhodococcus (in: high G+C Gram-positive bacteria) TaxID=192944 RepID=UPI001C9BB10A|nr:MULTISPECIES: urea amidohydrolase [unclassified Rhodococcus (in: high G+C Gram-positive bacteria)]MBY6412881.1 urea amidohydrolase [Rhodococcus sp. BP-320]MBY6417582.1 urea amidohydrolase [Rhodococcus sp. BP-321]MBY6423046.1 urea amidohydrolase [Rhodococcus sp. BP-324]MBY6427606.1 urea amidohydrolase [Rhodococcus sp. BP-323]MBY6432770.1 urea amidohydrolase [Rhodococcus sp. BP-322]